jgi:hypothetical protein
MGSQGTTARSWAAIAAVASLGLLLAGCGTGDDDADDRVERGDVVETSMQAVDADPLRVVVPSGTLEVRVAPVDGRAGDLDAADDVSLVEVSTSFEDADVRPDVWRWAGRGDAARPVSVSLEVAGSRYQLGDARPEGAGEPLAGSVVVGVPSGTDAKDVSVAVEYDDLVQVVHADGTREPGPADPLYDTPAAGYDRSRPCDDVRITPRLGSASGVCRVDAASAVPYLPKLGWAPEGRSWLVVDLAAGVGAVRVDGETAQTTSVDDRSALDGAAPKAVLSEATDVSSGWSTALAFDVATDRAPGALDVDVDLTLQPLGGLPDGRRVSLVASAPLG